MLDLLARAAFDVVFLDYQLNGSTGLDWLRRVRASGCSTPVVMLTGQGNEQIAVELMKAGATDYLAKVLLTPETLGHVLRNALHIGALEQQALLAKEARRDEEISRRFVAIQEEERRQLAAELHDRASPNLSALAINLGLIADTLPEHAAGKFADLLDDSYALLNDTIASIRAISADFRSPLLDYAGFWPALESYAQQFSRRTGITVHAEKSGLDAQLLPDIETNLFRIAQQALTNCAEHSLAQTVYIDYAKNADSIELAISDDGVGFDTEALPPAGSATDHGLATMRERADFIGGRFSLETRPGRGTRIAVTIPAARAFGEPATPL
ncbi:MAG: hypothetical protein A2045_17585 [Rhodocyclales bacterium GWA2_65_20]|nr:MAG: hypothetical protein A2045_17585 [Rhodocyclales bacterium GWA2_65_20]